MAGKCLIVDVFAKASEIQARIDSSLAEYGLIWATSQEDAIAAIKSGQICGLILISEELDQASENILQSFQDMIGCLPDLQTIVCEKPTVPFLTRVFEFGLEQFILFANFANEIEDFLQKMKKNIEDSESVASLTFAVKEAIRNNDQGLAKKMCLAFDSLADYDHIAAFSKAVCLQNLENLPEALTYYKLSVQLNEFFLPARNKIAETLLLLDKKDDAIAAFLELEKLNDRCFFRKVNLARAFTEKRDFNKALDFADQAFAIYSKHQKLIEMQIHLLLNTQKYNEALKLIDKLEQAEPALAVKLNDVAVKLSKAGRGKQALLIYQRAHKIVSGDLKYKVSLNAALAARRMGDFKAALALLNRSEKEYGSAFPKVEEMRKNLLLQMKEGSAKKEEVP